MPTNSSAVHMGQKMLRKLACEKQLLVTCIGQSARSEMERSEIELVRRTDVGKAPMKYRAGISIQIM